NPTSRLRLPPLFQSRPPNRRGVFRPPTLATRLFPPSMSACILVWVRPFYCGTRFSPTVATLFYQQKCQNFAGSATLAIEQRPITFTTGPRLRLDALFEL